MIPISSDEGPTVNTGPTASGQGEWVWVNFSGKPSGWVTREGRGGFVWDSWVGSKNIILLYFTVINIPSSADEGDLCGTAGWDH